MDRFVDYTATKRGMAAALDADFKVAAVGQDPRGGRDAARRGRGGRRAARGRGRRRRARDAERRLAGHRRRARAADAAGADGRPARCPIGRHAAQLVRGTADHWVHDEPVQRRGGPDGAPDLRAQVPVAGLRAARARALRAATPTGTSRARRSRSPRANGPAWPSSPPRTTSCSRSWPPRSAARARRGRVDAGRRACGGRGGQGGRRRSSAWTAPGRRRARRCSRPSASEPAPGRAAYEAYEEAVDVDARPGDQGGRRLQAHPRSRPRLLLRHGRADHEAAGDRRRHGARERPADDVAETRWTTGSRWRRPRTRWRGRSPRCVTGLRDGVQRDRRPGLEPALQAARRRAATLQALEQAAAPALDALLVARIDKFSAARLRVALLVLLGGSSPLFLFIGFFVSTRRGVREISDRLASLRDNCSADLSTALQRMTEGDLTVEVTPVTPPITTSRATSSARSPSRSTRSARAPSGRSRLQRDARVARRADRDRVPERRHGLRRLPADGGDARRTRGAPSATSRPR